MRERLVIRWPYRPGQNASWALTDAQGRLQGGVYRGELEQCAAAGAGRQVVVLVPAAEVLLTRASVPTRNRHRLLQAIPYVLEEQLADDVATLHFALGPETADGGITVAVVARAQMSMWLDRLQEAGVRPDLLVPDTLGLPLADNEWSLLVDGDDAILRTAATQGGYAEATHLSLMLEAALREAGDHPPQRLRVDVVAATGSLVTPDGLEVVRSEVATGLEILAVGLGETPAIDLLQGSFSRREQIGRMWRPWRTVAALAAAWVVLESGLAGHDIWRLKSAIAAQEQQIGQLFRSALPEVQRMARAVARWPCWQVSARFCREMPRRDSTQRVFAVAVWIWILNSRISRRWIASSSRHRSALKPKLRSSRQPPRATKWPGACVWGAGHEGVVGRPGAAGTATCRGGRGTADSPDPLCCNLVAAAEQSRPSHRTVRAAARDAALDGAERR